MGKARDYRKSEASNCFQSAIGCASTAGGIGGSGNKRATQCRRVCGELSFHRPSVFRDRLRVCNVHWIVADLEVRKRIAFARQLIKANRKLIAIRECRILLIFAMRVTPE